MSSDRAMIEFAIFPFIRANIPRCLADFFIGMSIMDDEVI